MAQDCGTDGVVDLMCGDGTGPMWGMASSDLNATLLVWPVNHELAKQQNSERDVLLIALAGHAMAVVDGEEHVLAGGTALLIEKGREWSLRAGDHGVRYLSVHLRRGGLQIQPR